MESERRQLTLKSRLSAHSLPDIVREFESAVSDLFGVLTCDGMKVKRGHLLNGLVLKYLALPHDQRIATAALGLKLLEDRLYTPDPGGTGKAATSDPVKARSVRPKKKGTVKGGSKGGAKKASNGVSRGKPEN